MDPEAPSQKKAKKNIESEECESSLPADSPPLPDGFPPLYTRIDNVEELFVDLDVFLTEDLRHLSAEISAPPPDD